MKTSLCLKRENYAYVAGLVDGEGCITFFYNRPPKRIRKDGTIVQYNSLPTPMFTITNNDKNLLEHAQNIIGGKIYEIKNSNYKYSTTYKLVYSSHRNITDALIKLSPYLISKKIQAEKMIEYCQSRMDKCPKRGTNIPISQKEHAIVRLIKETNAFNSKRISFQGVI